MGDGTKSTLTDLGTYARIAQMKGFLVRPLTGHFTYLS